MVLTYITEPIPYDRLHAVSATPALRRRPPLTQRADVCTWAPLFGLEIAKKVLQCVFALIEIHVG